MSELSEKIKQTRAVSGLTQEKFAEMVGVKREDVKWYESGKIIPKDRFIVSFSEKYAVPLEELRELRLLCDTELNVSGEFLRVNGYEGRYSINSEGVLVRHCYLDPDGSFIKSKVISSVEMKKGYCYFNLRKNGKTKLEYVHRLVANTFIPNPNNYPQVNHKDGNKANNRADNLEWVTPAQNTKHAIKNNLMLCGEDSPSSKLTKIQVLEIRNAEGTHKKIGEMYGISRQQVGRIKSGENWASVL